MVSCYHRRKEEKTQERRICAEALNSDELLQKRIDCLPKQQLILSHMSGTEAERRTMAEQNYFIQALSNFMFETASGGAIRHLADHGYTVGEILKMLDFPTPLERIQDTVWKHFLDKGILLLDEPGTGRKQEAYEFISEYDNYGRKSFRRVTVQDFGGEPIQWKETLFHEGRDKTLLAYLLKHCDMGVQKNSAYVSCDFGLRSRREPERFMQALDVLEKPERDYILGLPWERRMVYHRLDQRMCRIVAGLYEHHEYQGWCYFIEEKEKMSIPDT